MRKYLYKNMDYPEIIVISNGPGELASWVKPVVRILKEYRQDIKITILLPPCPFSSGQEERVARDIPGVDMVLNSKKFLEFIIRGKTGEYIPSKKSLVVLFGGDGFHGYLVSRRISSPAVLYTDRPYWDHLWNNYYSSCMVPDEKIKNGLIMSGTDEKLIKIIGNLLFEGVEVKHSKEEALKMWGLNPEFLTLGIMPGSRPSLLKFSLPYFLKVSEEISEKIKNIQFIMALSPHIEMKKLEECLKYKDNLIEGSRGELKNGDYGIYIYTEKGIKVRVVQNMQYDVMNICSTILSIPGTANMEAASLGIPVFVCYSVTNPAIIPFGGLPGLLGNIPVLGPYLKTKAAYRIKRLMKFISPANIMAEREILPEINVIRKASEVSGPVAEFLLDNNKRDVMPQELKEIFKSGNAAWNAADIILETMEKIL